jgi:very-short-patch-repair endonuclease
MTRLPPLPPSLRIDPFTYADGLAAGATPRRLRGRDLATPFRGVRSPTQLTSTLALATAYAAGMSGDQYFSHLTAAQLLGLRMPQGFYLVALHVTSVHPRRAPRARRVVGHQSPGVSTVDFGGLRVSNPVDTWLDCAAFLGVDDLIVMGDGLANRKDPVATLQQLTDAVRSRAGARGHTRLILALAEMKARTDSARESMLRLILMRAGLPEPEVNGEIKNKFGVTITHSDLVFREYHTVVEYDGGQHRLDEVQFDIDIERLDAIMAEGWRVIRVGKKLMRRRAILLAKITTALTAGGWMPVPTLNPGPQSRPSAEQIAIDMTAVATRQPSERQRLPPHRGRVGGPG